MTEKTIIEQAIENYENSLTKTTITLQPQYVEPYMKEALRLFAKEIEKIKFDNKDLVKAITFWKQYEKLKKQEGIK